MKKLHWYQVDALNGDSIVRGMFCKCESPKKAVEMMKEEEEEADGGLITGQYAVYRAKSPDMATVEALPCYTEGLENEYSELD